MSTLHEKIYRSRWAIKGSYHSLKTVRIYETGNILNPLSGIEQKSLRFTRNKICEDFFQG